MSYESNPKKCVQMHAKLHRPRSCATLFIISPIILWLLSLYLTVMSYCSSTL